MALLNRARSGVLATKAPPRAMLLPELPRGETRAPPRVPPPAMMSPEPTPGATGFGVPIPTPGVFGAPMLTPNETGERPAFGQGRFGQMVGQNADAFLAMGAGMLSGQDTRDAYGRGLAGFMAGSEGDEKRRRRAKAEEVIAQLPDLSPEWRSIILASDDPAGTAAKYLMDITTAAKSGLVNAGDGNIYDPNTRQWITAPNAGVGGALFDGNSVEGQALNQLVERGILTSEQALNVAAGKTITDPSTGSILFASPRALTGGEQGGGVPLTGPRAPTEGQANANLYASRMEAAEPIIEQFSEAGLSVKDQLASRIPLFGNMMVSDEFQQLDQAQRDFINATLRRESGAVISPEEFDNARKQYFPQPGDSDATMAQKRENRRVAREQIRAAAGPNFPAPPQAGQPQGGPPPRITNDAEFDALPSGAEFIDPEGNVRRKP